MNDRKKDGAKDGTMKDASSAAVKRLPFTDDWMFGMVMRDPEICRELLERILPDEQFSQIQLADPDSGLAGKALESGEDSSNLSMQIQAALKFDRGSRGVRFDAYVQSEELWAEIEMQVYAGDHLGKRSRYYAANMDVDMLMAGISYEKLKKTYVIFICTHDYMKKGEAVYFFQRYDVEKQLPFNDESYILILNASCNPAKVPEHLKALYAYINDPANTSDDTLMQKIDDKVEQYNGSEWRWVQVTFEEHVKHMEYLAREEGREEGRAAGRTEGVLDASRKIAANLKAAGMALEEIAKVTGLGLEEIRIL